MAIKRQVDEVQEESAKKLRINERFSMEIFIKNLQDSESSFLGINIELSQSKHQKYFSTI